MEIEALRKAVEDAGFFIGALKVTGVFNDLKIANEEKITLGKNELRFLEVGKQILNGEKTIRVLNKEYVTAKEFKKLDPGMKSRLQQTGKQETVKVLYVTI